MHPLSRLAALPIALAAFAHSPAAGAESSNCHTVQGISSSFVWCENDVTRMSPADQQKLVMPSPMQWPDAPSNPVQTMDLPAAPTDSYFNWHNVDGNDWMTPPRNQKSCGSCFVFGSIAALESQLKVTTDNPLLDIDLSEQAVIACIPVGSCATGGIAEEVGLRLQMYGVPDEACYPYLAEEGNCSDVCTDWKERRVLVESVNISVIPWTEPKLKAQLVLTPIVAQMQVFSDFNGYKSGVYSRSETAEPGGWHIVTLVGWDDSDFSWIVRNSWGSTWGDGGYFKISRAFDPKVLFAAHIVHFGIKESQTPGVPCLSASNTKFSAEKGQQGTHEVNVSNCGRLGNVNVKIANGLPSWLTASLDKTNLTVGQVTKLKLVADTTSLKVGTHEADVELRGGPGISTLHVVLDVKTPAPNLDGGLPEGSDEPDAAPEAAADDAASTTNAPPPILDGGLPESSDEPDAEPEAAPDDAASTTDAPPPITKPADPPDASRPTPVDPEPSDDNSGCGCVVAGARSPSTLWVCLGAFGGALGLWLARRRRS